MNYKLPILCVVCIFHKSLECLTLNITVAKLALVDIIISTEAIPTMVNTSPVGNPSLPILARYSFLINEDNAVLLWQNIYLPNAMDSWYTAANHMPTYQVKDSTFSLVFTEDEANLTAGEELTQVCVKVQQRTYAYNNTIKNLFWYNYNTLTNTMYPINSTITINAQGVIDATKYDTVPNYLKNIYAVATGSAS